jgi:DNA-binding NtrC family response regulator
MYAIAMSLDRSSSTRYNSNCVTPHLILVQPEAAPASPAPATRDSFLAGDSPAMRRLRSQVQRVAPYFRTALVRGEPGTGKEQAARALHLLSPGVDGPFVPCPIASLTEALTADEAQPAAPSRATLLLESAQGGMLYLEEIGELPYPLQASMVRLLKAFEERRVETRRWELRIVAATHRDLRTLSAIGQFRPDLYARLSVVEILVPPLRQREEDIPALAAKILRRIARKSGEPPRQLGPDALTRLQHHPWPGNLRELRRVLARAVDRAEGTTIEPRHLALNEPVSAPPATPPMAKIERLQEVIQQHVLSVLSRCAGNKLRAAELLGISRSTLYRMLDTNNPVPAME